MRQPTAKLSTVTETSLGTSLGFSTILIYTAELYPTGYRQENDHVIARTFYAVLCPKPSRNAGVGSGSMHTLVVYVQPQYRHQQILTQIFPNSIRKLCIIVCPSFSIGARNRREAIAKRYGCIIAMEEENTKSGICLLFKKTFAAS